MATMAASEIKNEQVVMFVLPFPRGQGFGPLGML